VDAVSLHVDLTVAMLHVLYYFSCLCQAIINTDFPISFKQAPHIQDIKAMQSQKYIIISLFMLFTGVHAHMKGLSATKVYRQILLRFPCHSILRVWATLTPVRLSLTFCQALVVSEPLFEIVAISGIQKNSDVCCDVRIVIHLESVTICLYAT
jgi:hypothetical protein